jgi:hypothetical protein
MLWSDQLFTAKKINELVKSEAYYYGMNVHHVTVEYFIGTVKIEVIN